MTSENEINNVHEIYISPLTVWEKQSLSLIYLRYDTPLQIHLSQIYKKFNARHIPEEKHFFFWERECKNAHRSMSRVGEVRGRVKKSPGWVGQAEVITWAKLKSSLLIQWSHQGAPKRKTTLIQTFEWNPCLLIYTDKFGWATLRKSVECFYLFCLKSELAVLHRLRTPVLGYFHPQFSKDKDAFSGKCCISPKL